MCEYCEKGKSMCNRNTKDLGIELHSGTAKLVAYALDEFDWDISVSCDINYCPMCRKEVRRVKHITLKEMLEEIVHSIVQKEEIKDYYYKNNAGDYKKITSVDLMYRIKFGYDDFTEYEWELEESRLYKEDSYDK